MNRGLAVVESFMIFKNDQISEQDIETAIALGWAVEMVCDYIKYSVCVLFLLINPGLYKYFTILQ
jgi:hypothetical protein